MQKYKVHISEKALSDLEDLYYTILLEFKAPITAARYLRELRKTIRSLSKNAEVYQIQTRTTLTQYGPNVRRINYKKMAVIFTIHLDLVYIHRIIPQNTISGL